MCAAETVINQSKENGSVYARAEAVIAPLIFQCHFVCAAAEIEAVIHQMEVKGAIIDFGNVFVFEDEAVSFGKKKFHTFAGVAGA
jgi:hypothetical protein